MSLSSGKAATDNPLVEAVEEALAAEDCGANTVYHYHKLATAALRAIEDAGWKVVKADE